MFCFKDLCLLLCLLHVYGLFKKFFILLNSPAGSPKQSHALPPNQTARASKRSKDSKPATQQGKITDFVSRTPKSPRDLDNNNTTKRSAGGKDTTKTKDNSSKVVGGEGTPVKTRRIKEAMSPATRSGRKRTMSSGSSSLETSPVKKGRPAR